MHRETLPEIIEVLTCSNTFQGVAALDTATVQR